MARSAIYDVPIPNNIVSNYTERFMKNKKIKLSKSSCFYKEDEYKHRIVEELLEQSGLNIEQLFFIKSVWNEVLDYVESYYEKAMGDDL